jgi:hypothetical protein
MSERPLTYPEFSKAQIDTFTTWLPGVSITVTDLNLMPRAVQEHFESKSRRFIHPKNYRPGDFEACFLIVHADGTCTYVASQEKIYSQGGFESMEKLTYFFDAGTDDEYQGHAELRYAPYSLDSFFYQKPFVGWTKTEDSLLRQGLGLRRLMMMNAYSQMMYSLPLHSDTLMIPSADPKGSPPRGVWEKLVRQGRAVMYREGDKDRFMFKDSPPPSAT